MLFPELNQANNWQSLEVWLDMTATPPYLLILLGDFAENYYVIDPAQSYQAILATSSYQEAKSWLLEDEYERFEGPLITNFMSQSMASYQELPLPIVA